MKVAFALPYVRPGFGIEHRTIKLARDLPAEFERVLLCLHQESPVRINCHGFPRIAAAGLGVFRHSLLVQGVLNVRFAPWLGRSWVVDAQYTPMTELRTRGRFLLTWYSIPPLEYAASGAEAKAWQSDREAMISSAKRADRILAISHAAAEEITAAVGREAPVEVLHIGCERPASGVMVRRSRRRILSVGRFALHKSHEDVIAVAAEVRRALPGRGVELVLCGTSPREAASYVGSLKAFAASLGLQPGRDVNFIENASDRTVAHLMSQADVFVSASRWEGFGMPLVEAQSAGLPSVAYRLWSHAEVVAQHEHLVEPGNAGRMAEVVISLLTDETRWQGASTAAQEFVEQHFPWSGFVERYAKGLRSL